MRRALALLGALSILLSGFVAAAAPASAAGGEIVIIQSVKVGNPVMGTRDACRGWVQHGRPVVPMTVVASFIVPDGGPPTGPYAVGMWDGGFGSWDDHFGTDQGKARTQIFHVLLTTDQLGGWHGAGYYGVTALVQDVGLAGGFASKSINTYIGPPSPTTAEVKCTMTPPLGPAYVLDQVKDAAIDKLKEQVCPICTELGGTWDKISGYSEVMNDLLFKSIVDDPPDPEFQQLAVADPPPVLSPPGGLSPDQQTAYLQLASALSQDIGTARALYTTINRIWGADNASNRYWYARQVQHMADLADQEADALDELPALYQALGASMAADLPALPVTAQDVAVVTGDLVTGFGPDRADILAQLGVDTAGQRSMADQILTLVDATDVPAQDGADALSTTNAPELAGSLRTMRDWARSALEQSPPVVTGIDRQRIPASGGQDLTITGANLQDVSGINFGPSEPGRGQGDVQGCIETTCFVRAPAGHGTVDVVAIGPGGPSEPRASARVQYVEPVVPHVTHVFPDSGPLTGQNQVTIFGSGLDGGTPYFGPSVAESWSCREDRCTVSAPDSASAGTVDVTVRNDAGTSATDPADAYTYTADAPPAPPAPAVTSLSPASASHLGGERVDVTGENFRGVTSVQLVDVTDSFREVDVDDYAVVDDQHLRFTVPSMGAGTFDLVLYGPGGTSTPTAADHFQAATGTPTITGVSPDHGPDIGGTEVTVTGTDLTGASFWIGDEFARDEVCTPTECTFTTPPLPSDTARGPQHISAWTSDGESPPTAADLFTYEQGPQPVVTSLTPAAGPDTGGTTLVVEGENLNGGVVSLDGTEARAVGFPDACAMTWCLVTTPPHGAGPVQLSVDTRSGTATSSFGYVHQGRPVVSSLTPRSGWLRNFDTIKIQGHNLEGGEVYFGATKAWNATCRESSCTVPYPTSPDTPGTVDVTVRTISGTSATSPDTTYTWYAPTVTDMSPATGWTDGQSTVTLTGTRLKGATVWFGDRTASDPCATQTTCVVLAPKTPTTGAVDVQVTAEDDMTSVDVATPFTYTQRPLPTVTGISPDHGGDKGGDDITVSGTDLLNGTIQLGAAQLTTSCTNTSCTARTPAHTPDEPVDVTVTTSAGTSATGSATYTYEPAGPPVVSGVSPATGSTEGGAKVTVTGQDLTTAAIRFDGTPGVDTTCSRTACTTTAPPHAAGPVDVTASTALGTSATGPDDRFTYEPPPAPEVTGVDPATGPESGGQRVTVTGSHLYGATVSFGAVPATNVSCTDVRCTVTQPAGTGAVHVVATTDGGSSPETAADAFDNAPLAISRVAVPGVTGANGGGFIARGADDDLWFAITSQNRVGRIAADGTISSWQLPTANAQPGGITLGPDGRTWFTEKQVDKIGAIDSSGAIEEFQVPGVANDLRYIAAGPDGRLWFTLSTSGAIGAITTDGKVTLYHLPDYYVVPYHLTAGPDGRMWFSEWGGDHVGAITTSGDVTEYPLPVAGTVPWQITRGPDDRLWLTQAEQREILAIDTAGTVTAHRLPQTITNPQGLTLGPDGRLWFVAPDSEQVSAFDPTTGATEDYAFPAGPDVVPKYVGMDRNGDLWITGSSGAGLLKVAFDGTVGAPAVTDVAPRYGAAGDELSVIGSGLSGVTGVTVGGTAAAFHAVDPAHLRVTAPTGPSGTVDVVVTTAAGPSPVGPSDRFSYGTPPAPAPVVDSVSPPSGPTTGGTTVTVSGTHLAGGTVSFGGQDAADASCGATSCTATAPAQDAGTVHVTVTTPAGTSGTRPADRFTYLAPAPPAPVVTAVAPDHGPDTGGTAVTISGDHLDGGTVRFGMLVADGTCAASSCTVTVPPGGAGVVDVAVFTAGGRSALTAADRFTYVASGSTASTVALAADSASIPVGSDLTLTAQVAPAAATGTITFLADGTAVGSAPVVDGSATATVSALTKGTHDLTATYTGDDVYGPSASDPVTVEVTPGPDAITSTDLYADPDHVAAGEATTLVASVYPEVTTGTVTFADSDGVLGTAELSDGPNGHTAELTVSFPQDGEYAVRATYAGDADHEPSESEPVYVVVGDNPSGQVDMTLTADPPRARERQQVALTATVALPGANGQVMFTDDFGKGSLLGTVPVADGKAVLRTSALAAGTHHVTAVYYDSSHYGSAGPVPVTVTRTGSVPGKPRPPTAKPGHRRVALSWHAPSSGGARILRYAVKVGLGKKVVRTITTRKALTRLTVTRLRPGKRYRFAVAAVNATGRGAFSGWSKQVRPRR